MFKGFSGRTLRNAFGKNCLVLPFLPGGRPFFSSISAVKTVKITHFMCLSFLQGGTPFSSTISAVKTVNNPCFYVFTGGRSFFFCHIRGKNGKNRFFFTVFTGGRFLFQYHIRDQNGKINCCSSCTVLIEGGKRVYVLFFQFLTDGHRCFFCHIRGR